MLEVGDVVKVKESVWRSMFNGKSNASKIPPEGPIFWICPVGIHRVMIEGCGWQFRQEDVEFLYMDIDVSEFE